MKNGLLIALFCLPSLFSCNPKVKKETAMPHTPVTPDKAVIYELFIRNFTQQGTINAIIPHLGELKDLGVNTIWLMPIQPTGKLNHKGTYGSPYAVQDYYAVNPDYGTKDDFKNLVDSIHEKGMSVIIDMVANHTAWDNAWVTQHPDWYTHDSVTGKIVSPVADWTDVADLNYNNKELRAEMTKMLKYWVDTFDIDGYRCDVAEMVPLDFWKEAIGEINKTKHVFMLAEGADPKLIESGFQVTYGWEMYNALKKIWKGEKPVLLVDSVVQTETKYAAGSRRMRFITNHDETSWDNSPVVLFNGIAGSQAAYVVMATLPGVPLIYNGQEYGNDKKVNLFEKIPVDRTTNAEVREFYKRILALYNANPILQTGSLQMINMENNGLAVADGILGYYRTLGNEKWLIMVNTTGKNYDFTLPEGVTKENMKILFSDEKNVNMLPAALNPYGYLILKVN